MAWFFLPWWATSAWMAGPYDAYLVLIPAFQTEYVRPEQLDAMRFTALIATIPLLLGIITLATGLAHRAAPQPRRFTWLLALVRIVAGITAALGIIALVVSLYARPMAALAYPYQVPSPSFGQLALLLGVILAFDGLAVMREERRALARAGIQDNFPAIWN